jgi:hypothetical protein
MSEAATYILTTSSHDDYRIIGVFTGPPGVGVSTLAKRWALAHPERAATLADHHQPFDAAHFRDFVLREAGLTPVKALELWLPDYGPDMARELRRPHEKA